MDIITCIAPVNIAVIKYWGKRDEDLILPLNDSLSATLSTEQMHAKTTVMASPEFTADKIWLNGKEESFDNPRYKNCLEEIRRRARMIGLQNGGDNVKQSEWKVHVCSQNNFPTAAGLASSAAGFACLVYSLCKLFNVEGNISNIARLGSGSACRSVFGGFVQWHRGSENDGSDSVAKQLVPSNHWPELRVLILVVNEKKKKVSSTKGMQQTVQTSDLLQYRISHCVPKRLKDITQAIHEKDFYRFAELTIKDSNQFHAVCLDTYPPAVYMIDTSHAIVDFVHNYNKMSGENRVAYTFDAGPNACLFLEEKDVPEVLSSIQENFPPEKETLQYIRGIPITVDNPKQDIVSKSHGPHEPGLLKYIIHTKLGEGPRQLLDKTEHLLNSRGIPKSLS